MRWVAAAFPRRGGVLLLTSALGWLSFFVLTRFWFCWYWLVRVSSSVWGAVPVDGRVLTSPATVGVFFVFSVALLGLFFVWSPSCAEAFRLVGQHLLAPLVVKGIDYVRLVYMA